MEGKCPRCGFIIKDKSTKRCPRCFDVLDKPVGCSQCSGCGTRYCAAGKKKEDDDR
ncbi:MAG: hypothetical protein HPY66_3339 [Firmicutes bacterium]|nr:hypothetical protein [Bacillota bacterium]